MNEIGLYLFHRITDNLFLEILHVSIMVEAGPVPERLLVAVGEKNGFTVHVNLVPEIVFCFGDLSKKGFIGHGIPLDIGVHLHSIFVSNGSRLCCLFHMSLLSFKAKALVAIKVINRNSRLGQGFYILLSSLVIV